MLKPDTVIQPGEVGQASRHLAKFLCQVDAAHPASECLHDIACRTANAAANVQDVVFRRNGKGGSQLLRCLDAATMKVIEGCQTLNSRGYRDLRRLPA